MSNDAPDLLPKLTRYLDYFQAMTEVGKALTSNTNIKDVLDAIMASVTQLIGPHDWSLLLVEGSELYFEIAVGEAAEAIKDLRLPLGEGIAGWCAKNQKTVVVDDVNEDPRFSPKMDQASTYTTGAIIAVPLVVRGQSLGVIELVKKAGDPERFSPEHQQVLTLFGEFAAIAIDNARNFKVIEDMTVVDEWTGLYNARFMWRSLPDELARSRRYGHTLSVLFLDLDGFKEVNDTYGHNHGSRILREVGAAIREEVRETDQAIRYGGDEFVVLMPETGKSDAINVAERVRAMLESRRFVSDRGDEIAVSASIGVACYPSEADEPKPLIEAADRAMYAAKSKGRNGVVDAAELPGYSAKKGAGKKSSAKKKNKKAKKSTRRSRR